MTGDRNLSEESNSTAIQENSIYNRGMIGKARVTKRLCLKAEAVVPLKTKARGSDAFYPIRRAGLR